MLEEIASELAVLLAHKHRVDAQRTFTMAAGKHVRAMTDPQTYRPEDVALEKLAEAFKIARGAVEVFVRARGLNPAPQSPAARKLAKLATLVERIVR